VLMGWKSIGLPVVERPASVALLLLLEIIRLRMQLLTAKLRTRGTVILASRASGRVIVFSPRQTPPGPKHQTEGLETGSG
jgi:hypothetical protein